MSEQETISKKIMAMERGYRYHAMFIYNKPKLKNNRHVNPDYELSFNVVKFAVAQLAIWGFEKTYYHDRDAVPGSYKLDEFFYSVKASRFTVVVFTKEFLKDCWGKYKSQAAFTNLIDKNESNRFIALFIGVDDQQIPDAFRTMNSLSFSNDWQNEHGEWKRFKRLLKNVTHAVQDTESEVVPVIQGNNNLETDAGPEDLDEVNDNLQPGNQNTTNSPYYRDQSNQQSSGGNQHILGFSMAQSNEILYQRNRTNGLNSNNSAPVAITTDTIASSTTTASQHVENGQSTTKTGVGLTSSLATSPSTVMSTTGNNIDEPAVQAVVSTSPTMQTSGTRMPPGNLPAIDIHNSSDTNFKLRTDELPPEQLVCQKDEILNYQPDSDNEQSLDCDSLASGHQGANSYNTESIGMNRPLNNNSGGYRSMDESSENSQGASYVWSTMRRMIPGAISTMKNTVGTMIKHSMNFVQKCDQSYI